MQLLGTKEIKVMSITCRDSDRRLPPTRAGIDAMKRTLEETGQQTAIAVYMFMRGRYQVIAGATRVHAAAELGWNKIRADIWGGSAEDHGIHERTENAVRRVLTDKQTADMRAEIKELQRQKLERELATVG